jgi:hypothetical protein
MAWIGQGGCGGGVSEGIAHPSKGLKGLLHRRLDQAKPSGQGDPCPEGTQGPIGLKERVRGSRSR